MNNLHGPSRTTVKTFDHSSPRHWLWSHLKLRPLLPVYTVLGEIAHGAASVATVVLLGQLVDQVLSSTRSLRGLEPFIWALFGLVLLRFVAGIGAAAAGQALSERLQQTTREEAFGALLQKDAAFHARERSGDLMARITGDAQMLSVMVLPGMTMLLSSVLSTVMPLIGIGLVNAQLLIIPVLFTGAAFLLIQKYSAVLEPLTWWARGQYGALNTVASEAISGIDVVRSHGLQAEMNTKFGAAADGYRDAQMAQAGAEARYLPTLLYAMTFAAALAHALWLQSTGGLTLGQVIAFMGLFVQFQNPVSIPLYGLTLVQLGMASASRMLELLNTYTPTASATAPLPGEYAGTLNGEIALTGVTFRLGGHPLLLGADLTVRAGEHVALIGATGSGKTSVLHLLNGTLQAESGRVCLGGIPVQDWSMPALRPQVAMVEQEVFLFNRTVGENVRFGSARPVTDEEVWIALDDALAASFVAELPSGLDTVVGERGVKLSGGQRQRLALARALIHRPAVLLLDDVTSALDERTGLAVQCSLRERHAQCTVVMVTNRWSSLAWADRILLLQGGQLHSFASVQELQAADPAQQLSPPNLNDLSDQRNQADVLPVGRTA